MSKTTSTSTNAGAGAAISFRDKFEEFISHKDRRRLFERESLAFEACEIISHLMETEKVKKSELAERIGKTKSDVTQLLSGSRNMTLHTFSDIVFALGYRVEFKACPLRHVRDADTSKPTIYMYRFVEQRLSRRPYCPERVERSEKQAKSTRSNPASLGA
jgi:plasmid maintenance system antidote protein VapI